MILTTSGQEGGKLQRGERREEREEWDERRRRRRGQKNRRNMGVTRNSSRETLPRAERELLAKEVTSHPHAPLADCLTTRYPDILQPLRHPHPPPLLWAAQS